MKTLFEITQDYKLMINEIEANEGEISEELDHALIINKNELESKSIAYLSVIKSSDEFINSIDAEIKRLQALKKRNSNLVSTLKERLLIAAETFGDFEFGFNKIGIRKSKSVIVDCDTNTLPSEFKTVKVTEQPNKAEIKIALIGVNSKTLLRFVDSQRIQFFLS